MSGYLAGALLLSAVGAQADALRIGNVIPGAGALRVNVTSMRAMRFKHLVPQHTDFSCAAAALATILKYAYGRPVTEYDVISGMFKVSDARLVRKQGFSMLDMKHYVQTLGFRGRGYRIKSKLLNDIRIPVIVLLDISGYKHFVVFKAMRDGRIYIGDPALGNRVMNRESFLRKWDNNIVFAVIGRGFIKNTVLLNPPEPMTMTQRLGPPTVVTNAELIDFGFSRADLF